MSALFKGELMYDPHDPLLALIREREPEASEGQLALEVERCWERYGVGFVQLGEFARDALPKIAANGSHVAALLFVRKLHNEGKPCPASNTLSHFVEVMEHIDRAARRSTVSATALRELFEYLMLLGRVAAPR